MGRWKLEIIRIWRTRRIIALVAVFLIVGLLDPILVRYLADLVGSNNTNITVTVPPPTPEAALAQFGSSIASIGTLVTVVVAAGSFTIDSRPALAAFYRSRVRKPTDLLLPRFLTVYVATCVALLVGIIAAWYETYVLIGPVQPGRLAIGFGFEALWTLLAIAVVALWSTTLRSVLAVVAWSIAILLVFSLISMVHVLAPWSPSALSSSIGAVVSENSPGHFTGVSIISGTGALLLLATAISRLGKREP